MLATATFDAFWVDVSTRHHLPEACSARYIPEEMLLDFEAPAEDEVEEVVKSEEVDEEHDEVDDEGHDEVHDEVEESPHVDQLDEVNDCSDTIRDETHEIHDEIHEVTNETQEAHGDDIAAQGTASTVLDTTALDTNHCSRESSPDTESWHSETSEQWRAEYELSQVRIPVIPLCQTCKCKTLTPL